MTIKDEKVIWVCPSSIQFYEADAYKVVVKQNPLARVLDGDWDKASKGKSCVKIFMESWVEYLKEVPLEETEYGKFFFSAFSKYTYKWDTYVKTWTDMWEDIRTNGYSVKPCKYEFDEYMMVDIGRNGQLFFRNGMHRLAFCLMLGISKIPVKVMLRHSEWVVLRNKVEGYISKMGGEVYAPLGHPDLAEYKSSWDDWRLNTIKKVISPNSKSILDVGSHWGYMSFGLYKDQRKVTAIELCSDAQWFFERLRDMHRKEVSLIKGGFFQFMETSREFDTVLFLNILHHFNITQDLYHEMCISLDRLKTKEVFLMCENPDSEQMKKAFWNPGQYEFAQFIAKKMNLPIISLLGEQRGRHLYRIYS